MSILFNPFPISNTSDLSKLKEFADDIFKFDKYGRKFSKQLENTVGKRRNCSLRAISPLPNHVLRRLVQQRGKKPGLVWERLRYMESASSGELFKAIIALLFL